MKLRKALLCIIGAILLTMCMGMAAQAANRYITLNLKYDYTVHKYNAEEVFVSVNGKQLTNLSMPPIIMNNVTLVPAREVFEAAGAKVDWKKDLEQVYVTKGDRLVVIPVNTKYAYIDGVRTELTTPAKIINNKTMIPLRFAAEALDFNVGWDKVTRIATINDKSYATTEATTVATTVKPVTEATTQATTAAPTTVAATTVTTTVSQTTTFATTTTKAQTAVSDNGGIPDRVNTTGGKDCGYDAQNGRYYVYNVDGKININSFYEEDLYSQLTFNLYIDGDYRALFDNATLPVNNDGVNNIIVESTAQRTRITLDESKVRTVKLTQGGGYIYITPVNPKKRYDKIIVLDAGHGGSDPGANGNNLIEKNLTLAMLNKAKALFEQDGTIKCYATRTTDVYPSFDARTDLGNEVGDAFISIHINAAENKSAAGTETYSYYANDQGNGLTSYMLAESILNNLLANLGTKNRNVKSERWIVLRQSKIPASLIEIGFITNAGDAAIMGSNDGQDKVAKAIFDSVKTLFNNNPPVR